MWDELANRRWVQMAGTALVVAKEVKRDKTIGKADGTICF
jgi:hypothetical protein